MLQQYILPFFSLFSLEENNITILPEAHKRITIISERLEKEVTLIHTNKHEQAEIKKFLLDPTVELLKSSLCNKKTNDLDSFIINRYWESCRARSSILNTSINNSRAFKGQKSFINDDYTPEFEHTFQNQCKDVAMLTSEERNRILKTYWSTFEKLQDYSLLLEALKGPSHEQTNSPQ